MIRIRRPGNPRAPWWRRDVVARGRMAASIRIRYPEIKVSSSSRKLSYELDLEVETYEARRVTIIFDVDYLPEGVRIFADGPEDSPHRFDDNSLCIWRREDPPELRWLSDKHRLVGLIEMTRRHLFREAYWRETGEWLGPETHPGEEDEDITKETEDET